VGGFTLGEVKELGELHTSKSWKKIIHEFKGLCLVVLVCICDGVCMCV